MPHLFVDGDDFVPGGCGGLDDGDIITYLPNIPPDAKPVAQYVDYDWHIRPVYVAGNALAYRMEDGRSHSVRLNRIVDEEMAAVYRSYSEDHVVEAWRLAVSPDKAILVHMLKEYDGHVRPYIFFDLFRLVRASAMVLPGAVDRTNAYKSLQDFLCRM